MPRIVDGDNLLGTWPHRRRSDAERQSLVREIGRFAARERRRVVLVFDGASPIPYPAGSDVIFSGGGKAADDVILSFLRKQEDRAGWTVVTSDRSLGDQCRWLGAKVERSDEFRRRLGATHEDEKPRRTEDVDDWLRIFGDDNEGAT